MQKMIGGAVVCKLAPSRQNAIKTAIVGALPVCRINVHWQLFMEPETQLHHPNSESVDLALPGGGEWHVRHIESLT